VAGGDQVVDHVSIEVAPARLAVQAEHSRPGALVEMVEAQSVDLGVAGLVVVAGQRREALVGGAEEIHRGVLSWSGSPPDRCSSARQRSFVLT
jgi:hypothetical protein